MSDFENDSECIRLDKKLNHYAEAVRKRQIERRKHIARLGNCFDINSRYPYPYGDKEERQLINEIDTYLLSFDEKDRAEVNAHFLREYKEYLKTPFAKHARELAVVAIKVHPLNDKDKIDFLEYLFESGKYRDFDKKTLFKLADYDPNFHLPQTNRMYTQAVNSISGNKEKAAEDVVLLSGMLNACADRIDNFSSEAVVNYAGLYFRLADKADGYLSPNLLGRLAMETSYETMPNGEYMRIRTLDKSRLNLIFGAYVNYVQKTNKFNEYLADSMFVLAREAINRYDYTPKEANALVDVVRSGNSSSKSKKLQARNEGLADLVRKMASVPVNPLAGKDIQSSDFKATAAKVHDYAEYLCDYAAYYKDEKVSVSHLKALLLQNASLCRLDIVEASLFSEAKKIKGVDKALVLDIAKTYASSVNCIDEQYEYSEFNSDFNKEMTEMFTDFVMHYNYNGREARRLADTLAEGAGRHPYFVETGNKVFNSYQSAQRRRYRAAKKTGKEL